MNKRVILALLILISCVFFCSCSINPHAFNWNLFGIYHEVTYVNGQTVLTWTSTGAYEHQPNGIHDEMVYIRFYEDGTIDFKPYDSEALHGTYKLKHNGIKDTSFTVFFDGGEKIENGLAVGGYFDDSLYFKFRGITYEFSTRASDGCTKEEYEQQRADIPEWIRRGGVSLREGEVMLGEGEAVLRSESFDDGAIDLLAENCALTVMQITAENELLELDEIKEGKCVFYEYMNTYTVNLRGIRNVVIYYVEPLPEELEPPEPTVYKLDDIYSTLRYYFDHPEECSVKISRSLYPTVSGQNDYHKYYTDKDEVAGYMSLLSQMTLTEEPEPPSFGEHEFKYTVRITLDTGLKYDLDTVIYVIGDYVKLGNRYFRYKDLPKFEYDGAVQTFSMINHDLKIYRGEEYMYDADAFLLDVEFIIDPKQDYVYMTTHDTRMLVCELGEIKVYDATHFWYKGQFYLVTSEKNFSEFYYEFY